MSIDYCQQCTRKAINGYDDLPREFVTAMASDARRFEPTRWCEQHTYMACVVAGTVTGLVMDWDPRRLQGIVMPANSVSVVRECWWCSFRRSEGYTPSEGRLALALGLTLRDCTLPILPNDGEDELKRFMPCGRDECLDAFSARWHELGMRCWDFVHRQLPNEAK